MHGIITDLFWKVYSNGVSEEIIGKAIKKYNIPRHKLVILSKCYGVVGEEPGIRHIFYPDLIRKSKDYVNQGGESLYLPDLPNASRQLPSYGG